MHLRIRQLAEQATTYYPATDTSGEFEIFDKEKFVESVILACADVAEGGPGCVCCTTGTSNWIKHYFGVEE